MTIQQAEMATSTSSLISLQPPEPFNFRQPEEWTRWQRRFEQFRTASGLDAETGLKQVSTLLYCMGEEADTVFCSTNATEDERKNYDSVCKKFDDFFKIRSNVIYARIRSNVIYERARFNKRNQLPSESAEKYIMELYTLARLCNYGEFTSEMIRDRLVIGISHKTLSEKLQLDPGLTLEQAKKLVCQREAVHEQHQALKKHPEALDEDFTGLTTSTTMNEIRAIKAENKDIKSCVQGAGEDSTPGKDVKRWTRNVTSATKRATSVRSVYQKG